MIDISKVIDYLYVGSRVGKEQADELKVLNLSKDHSGGDQGFGSQRKEQSH
jgi:hypothetical protein